MVDAAAELAFARTVISREATALEAVSALLDDRFSRAVELLARCADSGGTVLVSGLGKSGHVGAKISATMASLGIPSHAVHPTEAAHGDLGRFRASDTAVCLSNSGETQEVVNLAAILRQDSMPILAITRKPTEGARVSSLEELATITLHLPPEGEAGEPEFSAPTTSTTATLAIGDALALCVARRRNFTERDFARRHPGGSLGGQLRPVMDVVRAIAGRDLAMVHDGLTVGEALREADKGDRRRSGALLLVDGPTGRLTGIFTDGDLRRLICQDPGALHRPVRDRMTRNPRTLPASALLRDAVVLIREHRQDEIPIVDGQGRPVGLLDVQDLVTLRLVSEES
ncbi:MAG: KpsF/GutQ family sugar-phosphate isomerase [Phycisphaeraceae bacterium]|nr:KpsF/GutQ family sugar-phosphate isomerase [Phycisphaeraceae bacterium]